VNKKYILGKVEPWWDDSFKTLNYLYPSIKKNTPDEERWIREGYVNITLNGAVYNMTQPMPEYANGFYNIFPWDSMGLSFFRMNTLEMLPLHKDHYTSYKEKFDIKDPSGIWRAVVFLEDWKSGHYFEVDGKPIVDWCYGDYVAWNNDVPHFAGNFGLEPRYTMQITGIQK
jgi:hypothetical protein